MDLLSRIKARLGFDATYGMRAAPFLLMAEVTNAVGRLGLSVILARVLQKEAFGQYSYALAMLGLFGILALPGLDTAVIQAVARGFDGAYRLAVLARLRWATLGAAAAFVTGCWSFVRGEIPRAMLLAVVTLFFVPVSALGAGTMFFRGKRDFRAAALMDIATLLATVAPAIAFAVVFRTATMALVGYLAGAAVANICATRAAWRRAAGAPSDSAVLPYGKKLTAIAVIPWLGAYLDRVMIEQFLTFQDVAIFSIAVNLPDQARRVGAIVYGVAFPGVSTLAPGVAYRRVMHLLPLLVTVFAVMGAFGAAIMPFALRVLFPRYPEAIPYAQFSCIFFAVASIGAVFVDLLLPAQKATSSLFAVNVVSGTVKIVTMAVGLASWGMWGAVVSPLAAALSGLLTSIVFARRNFAHLARSD